MKRIVMVTVLLAVISTALADGLGYSPDGGMVSFGEFDYVYDSASRLTEVWSNGEMVVENKYDALGRRVIKWTPDATHTFVYDGWLLVVERIERSSGQRDQIDYWWGKDASGTLDGAGGIGGLLYIRKNGCEVYVPLYDGMGNVVQYVDKMGSIVAQYAYDAFGNTTQKSGVKADELKMRFSTKYFDDESGLYYFGHRFYSPRIARWLTRDPIEERGGLNLYGFCRNCSMSFFDVLGEQILIKEDKSVVKDRIATKARAAFFPKASVYFSCSWYGVLRITGTASRRIEILTPNLPRWGQRMKRYNGKWGRRRTDTTEWYATYAHEMDHWNSYNGFFAFLHLLNDFDGTHLCNKCNEIKDELNRQYNRMWSAAVQHSLRYDMDEYNYGGAYPKARK